MPVQRCVDLPHALADVTLERECILIGAFMGGIRHGDVLITVAFPHKAEPAACRLADWLISKSAEGNETTNHLFNRGCFNDRLRQTDASLFAT